MKLHGPRREMEIEDGDELTLYVDLEGGRKLQFQVQPDELNGSPWDSLGSIAREMARDLIVGAAIHIDEPERDR